MMREGPGGPASWRGQCGGGGVFQERGHRRAGPAHHTQAQENEAPSGAAEAAEAWSTGDGTSGLLLSGPCHRRAWLSANPGRAGARWWGWEGLGVCSL